MHQLGQPVAPSILFPVFKSKGKPGSILWVGFYASHLPSSLGSRAQFMEVESGFSNQP